MGVEEWRGGVSWYSLGPLLPAQIEPDLVGNLLPKIVTSPVFAADPGQAMAWGQQK